MYLVNSSAAGQGFERLLHLEQRKVKFASITTGHLPNPKIQVVWVQKGKRMKKISYMKLP